MIDFKILHATRVASRFFAALCAMLAACLGEGEGEHPPKLSKGSLLATVDLVLRLPECLNWHPLGRLRAPQLGFGLSSDSFA